MRSAPQRRPGARAGLPACRAHEGRPRRKAHGRQRLTAAQTDDEKPGSPGFLLTGLALHSTSSSALCRGSAAPAADARDKPEHDERGVGRLVSSPANRRAFCCRARAPDAQMLAWTLCRLA
ncbi:hypothetical protein ELG88_12540 [Rhizobium leguminosarum]|nr:hypothetical protein ELG88_12540 [Rhizobium leguminosarum]